MTNSGLSPRLPQTWQMFGRFVRRPDLAQPIGLRRREGWTMLGAMLGLHLLGLGVLLIVLSAWQRLTGIDGPSAFADFPKEYLVPAAMLAAPVVEETAFRGWLSGRPRALWLLGCLIAGAAVVMATSLPATWRGGGVFAALIAGAAGWLWLRKHSVPGWFARRFAVIFYASAAGFGLLHLLNYAAPGLLTVPMILPQLWAGLTLGFVRTRVGLHAGMIMHAAANGLALGLALAGGS